MKHGFVERVIRERVVDTRKYRYIRRDVYGAERLRVAILRRPVSEIGYPWERVYFR